MRNRPWIRRAVPAMIALGCGIADAGQAQQAAPAALGSAPSPAAFPKVEFAFEERVTLGDALPVGQTPFGRRNFVPITGGAIAGPKLQGKVLPIGGDWQLGLDKGCARLSADYFLQADDGTVIHILNTSTDCRMGGATKDATRSSARSYFTPTFEAPQDSAYAWLNSASFVAELSLEGAPAAPVGKAQASIGAIRIRFFQIL